MVASVFAPYWLDRVSNTPGRPMISASPTDGATPSTTCATSPTRTAAFGPAPRAAAAISDALAALCPGSIMIRWFGVSANPPPLIATARSTAPFRSASANPRANRRAGSARTSIRRCSPPNTLARATPGTASRRGRTVHSIRSRNWSGLSRSLVKPTFSRSIVEDTSGVSRGASTPGGRRPATSASASEICWRER